ncbi:MAG: DUF6706 family protein [Parcubacteria group bacterium]|jgi:hypothetical protein
MTIKEYIVVKLATFGYSISDEEITALEAETGADTSATYTASDATVVQKALIGIIPSLLARPKVTEGGFSVDYNPSGLAQYYEMLCIDLGIENTLVPKPKIKDHSSRW